MKKFKYLSAIFLMFVFLISGCRLNDQGSTNLGQSPETQSIEEKASGEIDTSNNEIKLIDNVGREVILPYPVETAVVANRYNSELIRACGAIDKVIAVDLNTAQDRTYWSMFDEKDVIGKSQTELNYEKIIELKPQVLILPDNGSYDEAEEILNEFNIKVFVISAYDTSDFQNQVLNIGKMFNVEEQANIFFTYFNDKLKYIEKNVPKDNRRTLYLETTTDYASTLPGDYFYDMAAFAGARNIFETENENINKSEVDPEVVINRNPDFIVKFITPSEALKGTGLYVPPPKEDFINKFNDIVSRPGWEDITAIRNDDVYFMTQFSHGGASKLVGTMYIAKWMYPDLLPELDPDEVFRTWMEDFQGFENIDGHFYSARELK